MIYLSQIRTILYILPFFLVFLFCNSPAQTNQRKDQKTESVFSLMGIGSDDYAQMPSLESAKMLIASVDENEYMVDAGDVFIFKVDVKGPALRIFNSVVTPDGYLIIPDAPTVYVRHLTLKEAKTKLNSVLRRSFPQASAESYLFQVHPIGVSVLGALPRSSKITLTSSNRLFDAVTALIDPLMVDTTVNFNWDVISFRNIDIKRKNASTGYDLLKFKLTGDRTQNPYLIDEDIIFINFRDSIRHTISVKGAVARPIDFEYKNGDRLISAVQFASMLLPTADSTRIELVRFNENEKSLKRHILSFPSDSNFILKADDRIYVRDKVQYHQKYSVYLEGEVKYPGEYAIENGKIFLSEIIQQAGGFTDEAAIINSILQRKKSLLPDDSEMKRLEGPEVIGLWPEDVSYARLRLRENRFIVTTDFGKLFIENNKSEDILLFDQDLIVIPQRSMTVFVSGGVNTPGNITFRPDWTYTDYIRAAGGFSDYAEEDWVTIIDSKTGKWKDVEDLNYLKEGDIIFVPESARVDWYKFFLESLSIVTQVATLVLVVTSLSK
jgi:protein involved in polysaccharide export with SLBB domain